MFLIGVEAGRVGAAHAYSSALAMMTDQPAAKRRRATVSVVVPFFGDAAAADGRASWLTGLATGAGDELIVADNTPDGVFARAARRERDRVVVAATAERSSYHARNVGAAAAPGEWLLFIDADCRPPPT